MKKLGIFLMSILALGATSCDDFDFTEATPQSNPQQSLLSFDGLTVEKGAGIAANLDLNGEFEEGMIEMIKTAQAPVLNEGQSIRYIAEFAKDAEFNEYEEVLLDEQGKMKAAELNTIFRELIGKTPKATPLTVRFMAFVAEGTSMVRFGTKDTYFAQTTWNVTPVPESFTIESAYYIIGDMNGWSFANLIKFDHSQADVYDDPVFSVVFDAPSPCHWKIVPQSTVDAGTEWNGTIWGVEVDGDVATEGKLVSENAQAAKIEEAGKYRITINMMDNTYKVEPVKSSIYMIGTPTNWDNTSDAYTLNGNGVVYTGTFNISAPADGCFFRFYTQLTGDWDTGSYGAAEADGTNIDVELVDGKYTGAAMPGKGCWILYQSGTYKFTLDIVNGTLTIEEAVIDPSTFTHIYAIGNITDCKIDAAATQGDLVCKDQSNVHTGRLTFPAADASNPKSYFRFAKYLTGDWATIGQFGCGEAADFEMEFDEEGVAMGVLVEGDDKNYIVPAGTYDVTVDMNDLVVTLVKVAE